jgi:nitroreductase
MAQPQSDAALFDIMWTTRAMRRFKPDPVPEEVLIQLVDAALHGPSGSNAQNWRFVIVRSRDQKEKLQKLWQKTWGFYLETFATAELRPGETAEQREKTKKVATDLATASPKCPRSSSSASPRTNSSPKLSPRPTPS